MPDRIGVPFTNEHFVAFCHTMLEQPYWYGTVVYKCTESLRKKKAKQYPTHYKDSRTARYQQDIADKKVCADCVGLIKGYAWTNGGVGVAEAIGTDAKITSKYASNGCPDHSASGMFTYSKKKGGRWGSMDTLPEIPGLALNAEGHVGVYIGNGYAIEERGFNYGCVMTKVTERKWLHWYQLPFIDYGDALDNAPPSDTASSFITTLGSRLLKRGMTGTDVKVLQELLMQLDYAMPRYGADGSFGAETETALMAFQKDAHIKQDGKYGDESHAALMAAVADDDEGKENVEDEVETPDQPGESETEEPDSSTESTPAEPIPQTVLISSPKGSKVNIRVGNDTRYGRITSVPSGTALPHVATAQNGWHAVLLTDRVGWVSGEFSKVS